MCLYATTVAEVRPEVLLFAVAMENKLRDNDDQRGEQGWKDCPPIELIDHMREEIDELEAESKREHHDGATLMEAADIGNMAMMIADTLGVLTPDVVIADPDAESDYKFEVCAAKFQVAYQQLEKVASALNGSFNLVLTLPNTSKVTLEFDSKNEKPTKSDSNLEILHGIADFFREEQ